MRRGQINTLLMKPDLVAENVESLVQKEERDIKKIDLKKREKIYHFIKDLKSQITTGRFHFNPRTAAFFLLMNESILLHSLLFQFFFFLQDLNLIYLISNLLRRTLKIKMK